MKSQTKLYLLAGGTVVYSAGYLVLIAAVATGEITGLGAIAAVLMATGILIAMVFGLALAKLFGETLGEL